MRRVLALLALTACAAVAAGCSGRDAQEAQLLMAQADAAFATVRSATFTARLSTSGAPQELAMTMVGGGYVKGKHAGEAYAVMTAENLGFHQLVFLQRGGQISSSIDGQHLPTMPAPETAANPVGALDLARYVEDVEVEHGKLIDGEPMTKVTGVIDTAGLVRESLSVIGGVAELGDSELDLDRTLGDTRIVLYLSDVTHLPMRGLVDMHLDAAGEEFELHVDFAYTSINERVDFPGLG